MLAKRLRLTSGLFTEVFTKGRISYSEHFLIRVLVTNLSYSRFSVVVSKKISGSAVGRNKIRRLVYTALQDIVSEVKPNRAIILFCKKGIEYATANQIQQELRRLLETT